MSLSDKLRKLAARGQYGHSRTPANYYMTGGYCEYYWSHSTDLFPTLAEWDKAAALLDRYHRLLQWADTNLWQDTGKPTYWGDNSVSIQQVHVQTGKTRTRMITAPHGDVC